MAAKGHLRLPSFFHGVFRAVVARRPLLPLAGLLLVLGGLILAVGLRHGSGDATFRVSLLVLVGAAVTAALLFRAERTRMRAAVGSRQSAHPGGDAGLVEVRHLRDMGGLLQSCLSAEEVYGVLASSAPHLFPGRPGGLYVLGQGNVLDTGTVWGGAAPLASIPSDDCLALRDSHLQVVGDASREPVCRHLGDRPPASYLCVPLMAFGNALGVLHVRSAAAEASGKGRAEEPLSESEQQLAVTVAYQIALVLANLRLRQVLPVHSVRDQWAASVATRRHLEESLERELRRAATKRYPVGVVMMEIDHLRYIENRDEREAGMGLLRTLEGFLRTRIRKEDIASRFGSLEFALVLPEAPIEVTRQRAEQLREGFKQLNLAQEGRPGQEVTLSMGAAVFPQHGVTVKTILRSAGEALDRARSEGGDRVSMAVSHYQPVH